MELLQNFLRRPTAASVVSLIAAIAFYVFVGRADIFALASAASWLNFAANLGIVALPVGLLMIAGEIDISFGAMIPAGAITTALLSGTFGLPIEVGILGALSLGVVVGLINGVLATRTKVPSLLITLGTLTVMQGIVLWAAMDLAGNLNATPVPDGPWQCSGERIGTNKNFFNATPFTNGLWQCSIETIVRNLEQFQICPLTN